MAYEKWYATKDPDGSDNRASWTVGPLANEPNWETDGGCPGYGMTKERAGLAAAAPDLLVLCKRMWAAHQGEDDIHEVARACKAQLDAMGEIAR